MSSQITKTNNKPNENGKDEEIPLSFKERIASAFEDSKKMVMAGGFTYNLGWSIFIGATIFIMLLFRCFIFIFKYAFLTAFYTCFLIGSIWVFNYLTPFVASGLYTFINFNNFYYIWFITFSNYVYFGRPLKFFREFKKKKEEGEDWFKITWKGKY